MAYSAGCNACAEGVTVEDYCKNHNDVVGCPGYVAPVMCCFAMTPECLACGAGMTIKDYC